MAQSPNQPKVTYSEAYQAIKQRRRAELGQLLKIASDNNPTSSHILGGFFLLLGVFMTALFPPLGAVASLVGVIGIVRGFKLSAVRRKVKRTVDDESLRWNVRDAAMEQLGAAGFETLASAVEAQGSYESVTQWMGRKGLDAHQCDVLILAAAVAAEERAALIEARSDKAVKARVAKARAGGHDPAVGRGDPFFAAEHPGSVGSTSGVADENEGMHARLLRESAHETDPATLEQEDAITQQIEAARRRAKDGR